jgi:alanine racemase
LVHIEIQIPKPLTAHPSLTISPNLPLTKSDLSSVASDAFHSQAIHRCWVEIDRAALIKNIRILRERVPVNVQFAAIVKADAYGHGLEEVVKTIASKVDLIGVATVDEALRVKSCNVNRPILILFPALPQERSIVVENGLIVTVSTVEEVLAFRELHQSIQQPIRLHLSIDTGMGRLGLWQEEVIPVLKAIRKAPGLIFDALSTHLPVADSDSAYTLDQLARFRREATRLELTHLPLSVLSSAGILGYGSTAKPDDIVRAGLAMYGISSQFQSLLHPALTWKTRITLVRTLGPGRSISYGRTFIAKNTITAATLGIGYGDGFRRDLSQTGAEVLIHGQRCPLLGRVTMDNIVVDVSHLKNVQPGDEVVIIGKQGNAEITATELANKSNTISWEIFTGITQRVVRTYH